MISMKVSRWYTWLRSRVNTVVPYGIVRSASRAILSPILTLWATYSNSKFPLVVLSALAHVLLSLLGDWWKNEPLESSPKFVDVFWECSRCGEECFTTISLDDPKLGPVGNTYDNLARFQPETKCILSPGACLLFSGPTAVLVNVTGVTCPVRRG